MQQICPVLIYMHPGISGLRNVVTQVNDMIQLMVRKPLGDLNNLPDKKGDAKKEEGKVEVKEEKVKVTEVAESKVYKVGDGLDVRDRETGKILRVNE